MLVWSHTSHRPLLHHSPTRSLFLSSAPVLALPVPWEPPPNCGGGCCRCFLRPGILRCHSSCCLLRDGLWMECHPPAPICSGLAACPREACAGDRPGAVCVAVSRLEERESEMKKEYNALHQRHTEVGPRGCDSPAHGHGRPRPQAASRRAGAFPDLAPRCERAGQGWH